MLAAVRSNQIRGFAALKLTFKVDDGAAIMALGDVLCRPERRVTSRQWPASIGCVAGTVVDDDTLAFRTICVISGVRVGLPALKPN